MLEPQLIGIGARHLERLVIALAGALAVWLGYRLFINMPLGEKGSGKLQLPGGISIFVSRVGSGVFFALFGAGVLASCGSRVAAAGAAGFGRARGAWSSRGPGATATRRLVEARGPALDAVGEEGGVRDHGVRTGVVMDRMTWPCRRGRAEARNVQ